MSAASVVDVRGLEIAYPGEVLPVLSGLDLAVGEGESVTVVGPSGAGKSTILRVLAGLMEPRAGTVEVAARAEPGTRPMALVFQEPRLLPWRRVRANVEIGLEGLGLSAAERRSRAEETLALVGLSEHAGRWPSQLSGGQRQRVGIARALAVRPRLLLMDEPFGALDAITRRGLQAELLRLWRATGVSVLFVTHDIDEAVMLGERVLLLGGRPATVVRRFEGAARSGAAGDPSFAAKVADVHRGLEGLVELGEGI
jgi:NitT/TauT family transport system ATP-binding protein